LKYYKYFNILYILFIKIPPTHHFINMNMETAIQQLIDSFTKEVFFEDPIFREKYLTNELITHLATTHLHEKLTTSKDCNIEREYDENEGLPVYGWSIDTNDCIYEPTVGVLTDPPPYRSATGKWREVLLERFEQQSVHGGDLNLPIEDFTGVFHESTINKRSRINDWVINT